MELLEAQKRVLGPEHRSTLVSVANLALAYSEQGRWGEMELLEMEMLEVQTRVLGPEHSLTLKAVNSLALTHGNEGDGARQRACWWRWRRCKKAGWL